MTSKDPTKKKVTNLPTRLNIQLELALDVVELFDGARLTQARQLAALTKSALADKIDVSAAAVGQYEAGTIRPRPELVLRLAEVLGVPVRFFAFSAGRPKASLDVSMAHFSSLRSTRAYERERGVAYAAQVWELSHALGERVRLPSIDLPGWVAGEVVPSVPGEPAAAARELRRRWGLGEAAIPHMVRLLESKGIIVTLLPFSEAARVKAFSTARLPRPVVVLTTDRDDVYHLRFAAAHELGHLVMHGEAQPGDIEHEREADAFAAEFLMPSASIMPSLPGRVDFNVYARLQTAWGVSIRALIYRSRELGLLGDMPYRRAWQRLHELQESLVVQPEPIDAYPGEQPVLLKRALEISTKSGVGIEALADRLHFSTEMINFYLGEEVNKLPEVDVSDFLEPGGSPARMGEVRMFSRAPRRRS
ncbi:XRE family transcriptional regulator [Dactylosporangium sp. NPDC048998]|uniref:XRE family transcriptional regulator n=1 Tax=Dactylosporangium sp. NPDC048998 TaxID=3363976 RepID=UPI003710EAD5